MAAAQPLMVSSLSKALTSLKADLVGVAELEAAQEAKLLRSRNADLATILENGGIDDQRTLFVFYALFKEFGPRLLSDEGLRRLADTMREPKLARAG